MKTKLISAGVINLPVLIVYVDRIYMSTFILNRPSNNKDKMGNIADTFWFISTI